MNNQLSNDNNHKRGRIYILHFELILVLDKIMIVKKNIPIIIIDLFLL